MCINQELYMLVSTFNHLFGSIIKMCYHMILISPYELTFLIDVSAYSLEEKDL
jgi:hypothetical protein